MKNESIKFIKIFVQLSINIICWPYYNRTLMLVQNEIKYTLNKTVIYISDLVQKFLHHS